MATTQYAGVSARPGELTRGRVRVGALVDGTPITLPVVVAAGNRPGPTVYLQGGLHGDEVTGMQILLDVVGGLDPAEIAGTVVVVPCANPAAFLTRTRGFALEERGPLDLNRALPGQRGGLFTTALAAMLFEEFILRADVTLDFHSALAGCVIAPFTYLDPADDEMGTLALRERLSRAFGTPLVYRAPRGAKLGTSDMTGSLATQGDLAGRPVLTVEMGESNQVTWRFVQAAVKGTRNVLRAVEVLDEPVEPAAEQMPFSEIAMVHSPSAGMIRPCCELGARVDPGDPLFTVVDLLGQQTARVDAPVAGTVLRLMTRTPVMPGAELCWIAH